MQELSSFQRGYIDSLSHPTIKKESSKDFINDRDSLLAILCSTFSSEQRNKLNTVIETINLSENVTLEDFLKNFKKETHVKSWSLVVQNFKIHEDLLEEFIEDVPLDILVEEQVLTEKFLRTFRDLLNWKKVSRYQIISEEFAEEFAESVDWNVAIASQTFSIEFILKFKDKIQIKTRTAPRITGAPNYPIWQIGDIVMDNNWETTVTTSPWVNLQPTTAIDPNQPIGTISTGTPPNTTAYNSDSSTTYTAYVGDIIEKTSLVKASKGLDVKKLAQQLGFIKQDIDGKQK